MSTRVCNGGLFFFFGEDHLERAIQLLVWGCPWCKALVPQTRNVRYLSSGKCISHVRVEDSYSFDQIYG